MKNPVSFLVVEAILAPILDPQEPVFSDIANVDGNNQQQVREVIRRYIKPYFESFDDRSKKVIADSVLYFSSTEELPDITPLDALPTPFELKQSIVNFCTLLSDELNIVPTGFHPGNCEYMDNLTLVHRLRRLKK